MRFGVLGPFEVWADGTSVRPPGRVPSSVLAVLVLEAGHVVSTSRMVDMVWGDDPPDTARRQVQNTAARLRRLLGPELIEAVGDGYRLRLGDASVDAAEFEESVRRAARLDGDPAAALRTLRQGLALWRGDPLTDLSGRMFTAAANRWNELRWNALEASVDLELRLGRHAEVTAELQRLTAEQPYRQRLAEQLMVALYRNGRTTDALRVYEDVRARLAEELGLDPDPALRECRLAILRNDPALQATSTVDDDRPAAAVEPAVSPRVPAQLPTDVATFTGRAAELKTLSGLAYGCTGSARVVAIAGPGGFGKTALAVHWAHRHRADFPDGQLYINLRGFGPDDIMPAHTALERFLVSLGLSGPAIPSDVDGAAELFRSMVADRKMLVILDNARNVEQVRPLLPSGTGTVVVVTSRDRLAGLTALDDAHHIGLGALSRTESLELLAALLGPERLSADQASARRLAELCAGLPLALRIAAANLVTTPHLNLPDYVAALEGPGRLDLLAVGGDSAAAVRGAFDHSLRSLDERTRQVFLRLGLIPGEDFPFGVAAAVTGPDIAATRRALARLETAYLVEQHLPGRYRFHDLIRLYASERAKRELPDTERESAVERYIEWHYGQWWHGPHEALNICAAYPMLKEHPRFWKLATGLHYCVYAGHAPTRVHEVLTAAERRARRAGDRSGLSQISGILGAWHRTNGDLDAALIYARRAMSLAHDAPDLETVGLAKGGYLLTLRQSGRYREAEGLLIEVLAIADRLANRVYLQLTLYHLGVLCRATSRYDEAFMYFERALTLDARAPLPAQHALVTINRAVIHIETGQYTRARAELDIAAPDVADGFDARAECFHLCTQGDLAQATGDLDSAAKAFTKVLTMARRHGLGFTAIEASARLAGVRTLLGDLTQAHEDVDALLAQDTARQGPLAEAAIALAACVVHNALGEHTTALEHGERAVDLYRDMPKPLPHAHSLMAVADAYDGRGDTDAAERRRGEAGEILRRIGADG